jgi:hypothetical protein
MWEHAAKTAPHGMGPHRVMRSCQRQQIRCTALLLLLLGFLEQATAPQTQPAPRQDGGYARSMLQLGSVAPSAAAAPAGCTDARFPLPRLWREASWRSARGAASGFGNVTLVTALPLDR